MNYGYSKPLVVDFEEAEVMILVGVRKTLAHLKNLKTDEGKKNLQNLIPNIRFFAFLKLYSKATYLPEIVPIKLCHHMILRVLLGSF